jgi:pimeloyl-ACP methyl ester carboxylesterase
MKNFNTLGVADGLVVVTVALLLATTASASPPSAANSTTPSAIRLVETNGTSPDAATGGFSIVIRGLAHNPISNASVTIDFSNCPDVDLCGDQMDAAATVTCASRTVRKITNATGEVQFVLLGHSHGSANAAMATERARIFANGVLLGEPATSEFDLDGVSAVGANDLSVWLTDFGSNLNPTRSDYDASGAVTANDLSVWLTVFGAGGSVQSCVTTCP